MKNINLSLYLGEENGNLGWDLRVHIALDVARGLEYLHDGVSYHMICIEIILIYIFSNNCMCCCHSRQFLLSSIATSNLTIFSWISPCEPGYALVNHHLFMSKGMFGLTYLNLSTDLSSCKTVWESL